MIRLLVSVALIIAVVQSSKLSTLKKYFNDDESKAYTITGQTLLDDQALENEAKKMYRTFLTTTSLAQRNRLDSYFSQWTLASSVDGPFDDSTKKTLALKALEKTTNFHAALVFEGLVENRDDSSDVKDALKSVIFSHEAEKIRMFFTGDDDIILGLVIASQYKDGTIYFVTSISD